jgi:hypothetical protein
MKSLAHPKDTNLSPGYTKLPSAPCCVKKGRELTRAYRAHNTQNKFIESKMKKQKIPSRAAACNKPRDKPDDREALMLYATVATTTSTSNANTM